MRSEKSITAIPPAGTIRSGAGKEGQAAQSNQGQACLVFCVWKSDLSAKSRGIYVDRLELERLFNLAIPREENAEPAKDDNDGEEWRTE